ncbi:hypothetical protein [Rhodococcus koreensis]|uniref:hypothetical protein n=1 Tax=Rhodococcus koreensis TaxID=99653 RepID=UPI00197F99D6|nr:hypothetical protein [Rhodococcus koreensis]QSE87071.1 hypothetical protein JWS14_49225 [Rhodococcus koreensis]
MPESTAAHKKTPETRLREVAYYHEPYWLREQGDWIKSLLLFFDGVAILVPDYMRERPLFADPSLAQPLADQGLLVRLSPETLVDQATTETLTELLVELLVAGVFDDLDANTAFAALSHSRLGGTADAGLTEVVLEELRERGLARASEDGVSIPLHPAVRTLVLTVLPQLLRASAESAGYALQPSSPYPRTVQALMDTLGSVSLPTTGHVVAVDLEQVTLDLSSVPLDEVLDFRQRHGAEHRAYIRDLRQFVRDASKLDQAARDEAFIDRREALADAADQLRRLARTSWRRPLATFGVGIAGSAVSLAAGNPLAAGISAIGALLGFHRRADPGSAYSYLFQAQEHLSSRGH